MKTVQTIYGVFDTDLGRLVGIAPQGVPDVTFLAGQDVQTDGLPVTSKVNALTGGSGISLPGGMLPIKYQGNDELCDGFPLIFSPTVAQIAGSANSTNTNTSREGFSGIQLAANAAVTNVSVDYNCTSRKIASGTLGALIYLANMDGEASIGAKLSVSDGSAFTNWFTSPVVGMEQPGWHWIPISPPASQTTIKWSVGGGTPVFGTTDFTRLRLRCDFTSTKRPVIEFYGIFENPRSTKPQIILSFDDGYDSVYNVGVPMLERYMLKASCGIIADLVNAANYMTTAQLQNLVSRGHEMNVHGPIGGTGSLNNYVASPTRAADVLADVSFHRDFLIKNNLAVNGSEKIYIFPQGFYSFGGNGSGNTEIMDTLKAAGFVAARAVIATRNDIVPHSIASPRVEMLLPIAGHSWASEATEAANIAAIIQRIRDAGQQGKHVVLMFHKVVTGTPTDGLMIKDTNLDLICAAIANEINEGRMQSGTFTTLHKALTRNSVL